MHIQGLQQHHEHFLQDVATVGANHGNAADAFVVVKKADLAETLPNVTKTEASVCVLWGFNPATGEEVCLQWSNP